MGGYIHNDHEPLEVNELRPTLITDSDPTAQGGTCSLTHICQPLLQQ